MFFAVITHKLKPWSDILTFLVNSHNCNTNAPDLHHTSRPR